MKVVLIVAAVAAGLVVAILAFGSGDEGAGGRPRFARETSTNGLQGPSLASAPSLDTPSASDGLATARPTTASAPPRAMIVSGPYLVSDDYLSGPTLPANQQRVFRAPDGTIVALHHRLGGPKDDLHQIVMVHSHDGGRSWHGELDVGTEAPDATYSGVMDARGNLYVAYGRDATGPSGGAIKLRVLTYQDDLHTWRAGPENRVLWDWPGRGATSPTLTFHGDRLWLAYRYYTEAGYAIVTQYADLNSDGNYSASQWSSAIALTEPQESPTVHASLVSHGTRLSAFSTTGDSGVLWRLLSDPGGSPRAWTTPMWVFTSIDQGQEARFSAVADSGGNIHLVVAVEGLFVSHLKYDGIEWSRIRQLAVNNVFGPSIATDGQNIWTFWQKRQASGYSRIQVRPWVEEQGWDRVATTPWAEQFGKPFPSVLVYKERRGSYTDVTRYAANPGGSSGGQAVTVAGLLERPGDILYLGNDEKFYNLPLTLDQVETDAPLADLEYWDGSGWVNLPLAVESPEATNGSLTLDTTIGFLPPVDWEPTDVNGVTRFYLRLRKDSPGVSSLAAFRIISPLQVSGLIAASKPSNMIDLLWSERPRDSDGGRLWYGSVSFDNLNSESSVPEHSHKRLLARGPSALSGALDAVSLPEGSPGQFVSVSLDEGESHEFQLLDGQVRYVKVLDTQRVFRSPEAVTVWATATVEVGGPGLATQKEVIPVAYFQPPVVLNGVRIYVEITKDFNDGRLVNGGGTTKAARLMLSDAGYSLTDLTQYRWPFPGMIWGLSPSVSYYQSLEGSIENHFHRGEFSQSMPLRTPVYAWHRGIYAPQWLRDDWAVSLLETDDGIGADSHRILPLAEVDLDKLGKPVELGDQIGEVSSSDLIWGSNQSYEWPLLLAEWYMAESTPAERSYVKDWLVLGPYAGQPEVIAIGDGAPTSETISLLNQEFLPDEGSVTPLEGDPGSEGLVWKRFDGIVPGVVDVAEAVSGFPNSGWARINGNYPSSVAYMATYLYSPQPRDVVLNIGSSDGVKVWLDEDVVLDRDAAVRIRRATDWTILPDFYKAPVSLKTGWSRILVKLSQDKASNQPTWQFTFRVSDDEAEPVADLKLSPEKDRSADPLKGWAFLFSDYTRVARAGPPEVRHEWPDKVDLFLGDSYVYTLGDGTQRELTLLDFEIVYAQEEGQPRQHVRIDAEVEVRDLDTERADRTTVNVALGGVPVSVNGVRIMGYAADLGLPLELAADQGSFPLTEGTDVGFAVNDARYGLYPDLENFAYPYDLAFFEIPQFNPWLIYQNLSGGQTHAGYDLGGVPCNVTVKAITDGFVDFKWYANQGAVFINPNGRFTNPGWHMTHLKFESNLVPDGSWVTKGTPLGTAAPGCEFNDSGAFHNGSRGTNDFNPMRFHAEIWQYEHQTDFPVPRFWLALTPYDGGMADSHIAPDESGDIPKTLEPRLGDLDKDGVQQWRFYDNYVNGVVRMGEASSPYPFGNFKNAPTDSVGYTAAYLYSPEDHTGDDEIHLKWGMSYGGKIWLNGRTVFEGVEERYHTYDMARERPLLIDKYDVRLPLKQGWNTLIIKTNHGSRGNSAWLYTAKIGDRDGRKIPDEDLAVSLRDILLTVDGVGGQSIDLSWTDIERPSIYVETYMLDVAKDRAFQDLVITDLDMGKASRYEVTGLETGIEYFLRVKPYSYSDLGGSVYWQHMDVVSATPEGSSLVGATSEGSSIISAPIPHALEIGSPDSGVNIVGDSVTVSYAASGGSSEVDHVGLQLDDGPAVDAPLQDNEYRFTAVPPGPHTLKGWLVNRDGSTAQDTLLSVDFETLPIPVADALPWLSVDGNRIVDESGTAVILRGVNVENWQWLWADADTQNNSAIIDFERRAIPKVTGAPPDGWGANLIHIDFASGPINSDNQDYLKALDEIIALAKSNGAYTLLSYRFAQPLDEPSRPGQPAEDAIAILADRYKDEPAAIFAVGSEPHDVTWSQLKPRFTSMIDAIRASNPRALIAVPGTDWGRYVYHNLADPIERDNLIFVASAFDTWDTIQSGDGSIAAYRLGDVAAVHPVILGGFGLGFRMTKMEDLRSLLDFAEENGIGWTGWLFNDVGCPCMLSDAKTFETTAFGAEIKTRLQAAAREF